MCVGYSVGFANLWHIPINLGPSRATKTLEVESILILFTLVISFGDKLVSSWYCVFPMATYQSGSTY